MTELISAGGWIKELWRAYDELEPDGGLDGDWMIPFYNEMQDNAMQVQRERDAKVCENKAEMYSNNTDYISREIVGVLMQAAAAIRKGDK